MIVPYSYDRTAAKAKPPEASRTDGIRKPEVTRALRALDAALEAVHDCDPQGRDYQEDGAEYDARAYQKAVQQHGEHIRALQEIRTDMEALMLAAK